MLAGNTDTYNGCTFGMMLVKCDQDGTMLWANVYDNGVDVDEGKAVIEASNGTFLMAGFTWFGGLDVGAWWLVNTDTDGNLLWSETYVWQWEIWDVAYSVIETSDCEYLLAGQEGINVAVMNTDIHGGTEWIQSYGGDQWDCAYSIIQTSSGNYMAAGYTGSYGNGGNDFWILCLEGPPSVIDPEIRPQPRDVILSSAHPNPFNPTTTISFELPVAGWVKLGVFDVYGRSVWALYEAPLHSGFHQVTFDGTGLASGVYIYQLTAGEFNAIGKMMLIK